MTGPEDSHSNTRPISVAELLAKNGTIGAPPVGGRRRRRRGDTDSVTVAELTGEIPVVRDDEPETARTAVVRREEAPETTAPAPTNGAVEHQTVEPESEGRDEPHDDGLTDDYADAVADYTAHVEHRDADADLDFFSPPRRSHYAPRRFQAAAVGAEQMSPDPVDEAASEAADSTDAEDEPLALAEPAAVEDADEVGDPDVADDRDHVDERDRGKLPSYLRSSNGKLFGGPTVDDRPATRAVDDLDEERAEEIDRAPASPMSSFLRMAWVVGQCIIAVAFGAGLFVAFDQLWKWNSIVALVLGVLVILGLVVGVRVVRKTEDIGSTLIAVAVGALVTFGPLALLQAN
jgi:hypothetical protein